MLWKLPDRVLSGSEKASTLEVYLGWTLKNGSIWRISLAVQWFGLCAVTAKGAGSVCGWGTKIPQATKHSQNSNKKNEKKREKKRASEKPRKKPG